MTLYAANVFASVVAFFVSNVGRFNALRVDNAEGGFLFCPSRTRATSNRFSKHPPPRKKHRTKSKVLGFVFFLALSSEFAIFPNCSRVISLGYPLLLFHKFNEILLS